MTTPSPERDKALDAALAQIDKQYGKGSIMRMGEKSSMTIEAIPTGALPLDLALGVGGATAAEVASGLREPRFFGYPIEFTQAISD